MFYSSPNRKFKTGRQVYIPSGEVYFLLQLLEASGIPWLIVSHPSNLDTPISVCDYIPATWTIADTPLHQNICRRLLCRALSEISSQLPRIYPWKLLRGTRFCYHPWLKPGWLISERVRYVLGTLLGWAESETCVPENSP